MDKRTIVAFALSFLVLILWSLYFGPKSEQKTEPQVKEQEAQTKVAPAPEPAPAPSKPIVPTPVAQPSEVKEKEITVDTPLYKAVFSNAGPALKSFRLKKYHLTTDPQPPPVELAEIEDPW